MEVCRLSRYELVQLTINSDYRMTYDPHPISESDLVCGSGDGGCQPRLRVAALWYYV